MQSGENSNDHYKYWNRYLWGEGYYMAMVGIYEAMIKKYIEDRDAAGSRKVLGNILHRMTRVCYNSNQIILRGLRKL